MRFVLVLLLNAWSVPAFAQFVDVDEVVRNAAAERVRARCLLRAAARAERLAARYERADTDAAREQVADLVTRAAQERQDCMDAAGEEGLSVGVGFPAPVQGSARGQVQVRVHMLPASGLGHARAVRRVWAAVRRPMLACVEAVALRDASFVRPFEANYTVNEELRAASLTGVPDVYLDCFAWLRLAAHREVLRGEGIRVIVRIRRPPPPPRRDPTAVDFPMGQCTKA